MTPRTPPLIPVAPLQQLQEKGVLVVRAADRPVAVFFHGGRICEQGSPDKIFGAPENDRTRQFLKAVLEAT